MRRNEGWMTGIAALAVACGGMHGGLGDDPKGVGPNGGADSGEASAPDPDDDTADTGPLDDTGDIDADTGGDTGDEVLLDPPALIGLSPAFGPRGGGTVVTVEGQDLAADAEVRFGATAAVVQSGTDTALSVVTPAMAAAGTVDVSVTQPGGEDVLVQEYTFLDLEDATGRVGFLGALQWFDLRGGYWGGQPDYGVVQLWVPELSDGARYRDRFAPGVDQCASDRFSASRGTTVDLSGASALLSSSTGSALALPFDSDLGKLDKDIGSGELAAAATFDLTFHDLWGLPDFTIADLAETPPAFSLTTPDLDGGSPDWVEIDELDLSWSAGGADAVVVYIVRSSARDGTIQETLTCLATDDGAFSIPTSAWSGWDHGDVLHVFVGDMREKEASVPLNNGTSSVAGISWVVGVLRAW